MKSYRRLVELLPWLRPYRWWMVALLLGTIAFFGLAQMPPLFMRWLIDWALPSRRASWVLGIVGGYFGVLLLRHIFSVLMDYAYTWLGARVAVDIQRSLLVHVLNADLRSIRQQQVGDLLARLKDDVEVVKQFISETTVDILSQVLTLVISVAIMAWFDWRLAVVVVLLLPLIPWPFQKLRGSLRRAFEKYRSTVGEYTAFLQEMLSAILPIQLAASQGEVLKQHYRMAERYIESLVYMRVRQMWAAYGAEIMGNILSPLVVLGLGGILVLHDQLSVGELVAAEMYATQLVAPVVGLSKVGIVIQNVLAALDRLEGIYTLPQRAKGTRKLSFTDVSAKNVVLRAQNISFSYGKHPGQALQKVSLECQAGHIVAIVGPSGAGKSTLAYVLSGVFLPDEGSAYLGEVEIASIQNRERWVFLVPQEPFLFHATVRENLCFGLENFPSDAEIEQALARSQALEFVKALPKGLETVLGERGGTLSGGERQRLMLARAFLQQPLFLILDEITSGLDTSTEAKLLLALREWAKEGKGIILVTHRMSTAMKADRVYVLSQGRVVEEGAPTTLLRNEGIFARLYHDQYKEVE